MTTDAVVTASYDMGLIDEATGARYAVVESDVAQFDTRCVEDLVRLRVHGEERARGVPVPPWRPPRDRVRSARDHHCQGGAASVGGAHRAAVQPAGGHVQAARR